MRTLLAGLALVSCALAADRKTQSDIPYHVYGHAAAVVNGKIHLLGGCHTDDWQKPSASHQVYDPVRDKWERKAELPGAVAWSLPAVWNGKIYLFGGGRYKAGPGIQSTSGAWVYDPQTDRWRQLRDLPQPRMNGFAVGEGKFIYLSMGYDRRGGADDGVKEEFRSTYRYDPAADTYTRLADAPEPGCYIASGSHKGKVYAVLGSNREYGFHGEYVWADGALVYDPAADRWEKIRAPRVMRRVFFLTQCSAADSMDERIWVVGGMGEARTRTTRTEYFDMEKRVFVPGPEIPYGRCCGGGGVADGILTIAGGFVDGKGLGTPAMPTWTLDTKRVK